MSRKPATTSSSAVEVQNEQDFLRSQLEVLQKERGKDPRSAFASRAGSGFTSPNGLPSPPVSAGVGPMGTSAVGMPTVEKVLEARSQDTDLRTSMSRQVGSSIAAKASLELTRSISRIRPRMLVGPLRPLSARRAQAHPAQVPMYLRCWHRKEQAVPRVAVLLDRGRTRSSRTFSSRCWQLVRLVAVLHAQVFKACAHRRVPRPLRHRRRQKGPIPPRDELRGARRKHHLFFLRTHLFPRS